MRTVPSLLRTTTLSLLVCVVTASAIVALSPTVRAVASPPWFGPNVKVDALPSYTAFSPSLAVGSNGVAYLAYAGWGGSSTGQDIFFTKSTTGGRTWSVPVRVNNDVGGATQVDPYLTLDRANNVYITWSDSRAGSYDVFSAKSTNDGLSFSPNVRVNDVTTSFQWESAVAVDHVNPDLVHAIWTDNRNLFSTGPDIYYANSTDGGLTFNPNLRVNNDATATEQGRPAIAVGPDRSVYAVWDDPRNGARGRDIYFAKSTDLGNTWPLNIPVSDDPSFASQDSATLAVDAAGAIFVAWVDSRSTNTAPDIFASRSTNGGFSFAANVKVNWDEAGAVGQTSPAIAARPGQVAIAWADARTFGSTAYDVYWAGSADGLTSWAPSQKVNDDTLPTNSQLSPTIRFDAAGDLFAAWFDQRSTGQSVYAATLDVVAPTANAGGDMTVVQGASVPFDGSSSLDNFAIASYAWDFGDGATATAMTGTHVYATPGVYTCSLTVRDYSGNAQTASVFVTVQDTQAPVVRGVGARAVDEGQPLFFDASASTDNVGVASYAWDFGDGATASTPTATHVYGSPGTYTATLKVDDAAGNTATATMTITVRNSALLGLIQALAAIVAVLAIVLAIVGYISYTLWRRARPPAAKAGRPKAPSKPRDESRGQDPLDMPPPPSESNPP